MRVSLEDRALYRAFDMVEPIGYERADLSAALVSHTVSGSMVKSPPKIADLMPDFWNLTEEQLDARIRSSLGLVEGGNDGG